MHFSIHEKFIDFKGIYSSGDGMRVVMEIEIPNSKKEEVIEKLRQYKIQFEASDNRIVLELENLVYDDNAIDELISQTYDNFDLSNIVSVDIITNAKTFREFLNEIERSDVLDYESTREEEIFDKYYDYAILFMHAAYIYYSQVSDIIIQKLAEKIREFRDVDEVTIFENPDSANYVLVRLKRTKITLHDKEKLEYVKEYLDTLNYDFEEEDDSIILFTDEEEALSVLKKVLQS